MDWLRDEDLDRDRALTVLLHDLTNPIGIIFAASMEVGDIINRETDVSLSREDIDTIRELNTQVHRVASRLLQCQSELAH